MQPYEDGSILNQGKGDREGFRILHITVKNGTASAKALAWLNIGHVER